MDKIVGILVLLMIGILFRCSKESEAACPSYSCFDEAHNLDLAKDTIYGPLMGTLLRNDGVIENFPHLNCIDLNDKCLVFKMVFNKNGTYELFYRISLTFDSIQYLNGEQIGKYELLSNCRQPACGRYFGYQDFKLVLTPENISSYEINMHKSFGPNMATLDSLKINEGTMYPIIFNDR